MEREPSARDILLRIPTFAEVLGAEQIAMLAAEAHPAFFRNGTLLMSQGDLGGSMYVIVEGAVSVRFAGREGGEQAIATLGPGEIVGEMSLFTGDRRTASVCAVTNVRALEIGKVSLEKVFARSPALLDAFAAVLARRQAEIRAYAGHRTETGGSPAERMRRLMRRLLGPTRRR